MVFADEKQRLNILLFIFLHGNRIFGSGSVGCRNSDGFHARRAQGGRAGNEAVVLRLFAASGGIIFYVLQARITEFI